MNEHDQSIGEAPAETFSSGEKSDLKKLDKSIFLIMFLAGISGLLFLKLVSPITWIYVLWPAACLTVYFFYSLARGIRLLNPADSIYFLGFLFSLTSISMALYEFTTEQDINSIIRNFGLALTTTILGLFFRVMYSQLVISSDDAEQQSRINIISATHEFESHLISAVTSIHNFEQGLGVSLDESKKRIIKLLDEISNVIVTMKDHSEKIKSESANYEDYIHAAIALLKNTSEVSGELQSQILSQLKLSERLPC